MCASVARVVNDVVYDTLETLRISITSTVPSSIFALLTDTTADAMICDPEGELKIPYYVANTERISDCCRPSSSFCTCSQATLVCVI